MALDSFDHGTIHAFEPLPSTFAELESALGGRDRFMPHNTALTGPGRSSLTMWSANHPHVDEWRESTRGRPRRGRDGSLFGDDFCEQHCIDRVDLLKIGVEGHDLAVLSGFQQVRRDQRIEATQFEFNAFAVYARVWLSDFYELLGPNCYAIGKLVPSWIAWKEYGPQDERYLRCNFIAARIGSPSSRMLGGR